MYDFLFLGGFDMGFNLAQMIADLEDVLSSETEPTGILLEVFVRLDWWKQYAKEFGKL